MNIGKINEIESIDLITNNRAIIIIWITVKIWTFNNGTYKIKGMTTYDYISGVVDRIENVNGLV